MPWKVRKEIALDFVLKPLVDSAAKEALKKNTSDAVDAGSYGAPTILVTKNGKTEFFFGSDRFYHIADFLGIPYTDIIKSNL